MEFKAVLDNARILRTTLEAISFLIDETYLSATKDGIKIKAVDASHAALLVANFTKDLFDEYVCSKAFRFGMNLGDIIKILRRAKTTDNIQLSIDPADTETLLIRMKSEKTVRTFKLKSKTIKDFTEDTENMVEELNEALKEKFMASIVLDSSLLDEIVKDALIISEVLKIQLPAAEKLLIFHASDEAGEVGEVEVELDLNDNTSILDANIKGDCEGTYALEYMENIIKIQTVVSSFELSFGTDIPIRVIGNLTSNDGNPTQSSVMYILAPRVEDEEEDEFADGIEGVDDIDFGSDIDDLDLEDS